jgi:transposase
MMYKQTRTIRMSQKEVDRLEIIQQIKSGQLSQLEGAKRLKLSTRQVRRLQKSYEKTGAKSLVSKKRNKVSNNQLSPEVVKSALELLQTTYGGFGPTLAHEKLTELHDLNLSVESLRGLMIKHQLWRPKQRKHISHHQLRARRPCFGELVQIDGSPHDWFEGRREACCLIVFVDDATSQLMQLHFVEEECTEGYFEATEAYIKRYGRPMAFYSDRHNIFRVNIPEAEKSSGETQFSRALRELDIELICANSPQAKGRVERANRTLQDRLIKELRLNNICTIEAANAYLPTFMEAYNSRFAIQPASPNNAHRQSLPNEEALNLIFSFQATRMLSNNLEISYHNVIYQIQTQSKNYAMRKAKVTVCERKGEVTLLYKSKSLKYTVFNKQNRPTQIVDSKQVNKIVNLKIKHKPKIDHPWRKYPSSSQDMNMK